MSNLDHFEVKWYYKVNGVWFSGTSDNPTLKNSTYSYPSNATNVKVSVTPIAKTKKSNGKETPYFTGTKVTVEQAINKLPPETLSPPAVSIGQYKLTASIENISDPKAAAVQFEIYKGDKKIKQGTVTVITARASFECKIDAGGKYRARCRAINYVGGSTVEGEWSPYSNEDSSVPAAPTNVKVSVKTDKSVRVSWDSCGTATGYTVEYATNKSYFGSSTNVQSITVDNTNAIITGIEPGHEWYFRVLATNEKGNSIYSDIVYKVVGTKPEAPTTWSLTSSAVIGDPVTLYWVHNSEDGSKQNSAQIELTINGTSDIVTIDTSDDESDQEEIDNIYTYVVDLAKYPGGAEILWRVRTKGVLAAYSDWSIQRSINTYAQPTMVLSLGDDSGVLSKYPFSISASVSPAAQKAVSYSVSITSLFSYRSQDQIGNEVIINAGDEVYSKVFVKSKNTFKYNLKPDVLSLENNQSYNINVIAAMDSGLTAEANGVITVDWAEDLYNPDAVVTIDKTNLCAYISPYCEDSDHKLIKGVTLSVYRREYDGSFTEIATDLRNARSNSVTDPHPSLDYARYRIVATSTSTNNMGFTDLPALKIGEPSIVIQWAETWTNFDVDEASDPEIPFYTGSSLKLKYNVDVQESNNLDKTLRGYIGRKNPVSYYGTQQGVGGVWNTEIPKSDIETIYALRRLSVWGGDVYVREPNGMGYNASVSVSMTIKHKAVTIPVTLNVTKVEGDM